MKKEFSTYFFINRERAFVVRQINLICRKTWSIVPYGIMRCTRIITSECNNFYRGTSKHECISVEDLSHNASKICRFVTKFYRPTNQRLRQTEAFQYRWTINVWAGVIGSQVIGPYFFPARLTGNIYKNFLHYWWTDPLVPRILAVKTFPPGQLLLTLQPKSGQPVLTLQQKSGQPIVTLPPRPQSVLPQLPLGLPPLTPRPWAPCALRLPLPQLTWLLKAALLPGDIRAYRLTSPRYQVPSTPRPIPVHQGTQTKEPSKTVQHAPITTELDTQTDLWATTSASDSEPVVYPGDEQWGLIKQLRVRKKSEVTLPRLRVPSGTSQNQLKSQMQQIREQTKQGLIRETALVLKRGQEHQG
ncbi:hypothetical protein PUN28_004296 [Cardiocondyla obscurior]|uniref:Uncharacterized protein n=1 Tax=Cardiocondyla obscurior TaxID=286306 RepID=A0AAW2GA06_9HYME